MRMFRRLQRRAKSKSPRRSCGNRNRLNRNRKNGAGKSRSPVDHNRQPGTRTAVEGAGGVEVVEAAAAVARRQVGLLDKPKQVLL
jgi:hypothetical protein